MGIRSLPSKAICPSSLTGIALPDKRRNRRMSGGSLIHIEVPLRGTCLTAQEITKRRRLCLLAWCYGQTRVSDPTCFTHGVSGSPPVWGDRGGYFLTQSLQRSKGAQRFQRGISKPPRRGRFGGASFGGIEGAGGDLVELRFFFPRIYKKP